MGQHTHLVNRWYYRCVDCLTVSAADIDIPTGYGQTGAACGICGGEIENLGRVERDRLVNDTERCACDDRCTCATGPRCNCKCGGENHGTHRMVAVQLDMGPVPVLSPSDDGRAKARADEYRSALEPLRAERDRIFARKQRGEWIERAAFDRMTYLNRLMAKARQSRTHTNRMKCLRSAVLF